MASENQSTPCVTGQANVNETDAIPDVSVSQKRVRGLQSEVRKHFTKFVTGNVEKARCNACKAVLTASTKAGTSHLSRHVNTVCVYRSSNVKQQILSVDSVDGENEVLSNWKFDAEISRKELATFIILHELPFSVVGYYGFKRFVRSLNPKFKILSRNTVKGDCMEIYNKEKRILKDFFQAQASSICLTADMWTSNQDLGYLSITAHFVDTNWKLHKRIIKFCMVEYPHTAPIIANAIWKSLREWNLDSKVMSITLDNASVNDACIPLLLSSISERSNLFCDGKLFHVRCASHILNLIVQDGLSTIGVVIHSVRMSVKKIRGSPSRRQKFEECIQQVGLENKKWVSLDVPSRWNSTYLMLESALEFKRAFSALMMLDPSFSSAPTPEEWGKVEVVCKFLKHFYSATNIVSGTKYPTSNLYFHEMRKIKVLLDEETNSPHVFISSMALRMQEKFNKYWKTCNLILATPLILDPRYKLMYFRYCFPKMYGDAAEKHVAVIENAFRQIFADYLTKMHLESGPSTSDNTNSNGESNDLDMVGGWDQFICQQNKQRSKSEIDQYLEGDICRSANFDILDWWSNNKSLYPTLACMARDILAIPASTVASESAFSTGGRVLNNFRSSLAPDTVEALICSQDWIRNASEGLVAVGTINDLDDGLVHRRYVLFKFFFSCRGWKTWSFASVPEFDAETNSASHILESTLIEASSNEGMGFWVHHQPVAKEEKPYEAMKLYINALEKEHLC